MSLEFVRTVDPEEDREAYLKLKARRAETIARLYPPKVETLEDFKKVIESLSRHGQRDDLIDCKFDENLCTVYGVDGVMVDREAERVTMDVDRGDYEKTFYLKLNNLMDITVRTPTSYNDTIYERRMGGERPLKRYPDYEVSTPTDRAKCFIRWKSRGSWEETSPYHREGFEIYCVTMDVNEILEKFRDRMLKMAKWKLKKWPGESVTEEELRKMTKLWIADWQLGKELLEDLVEEMGQKYSERIEKLIDKSFKTDKLSEVASELRKIANELRDKGIMTKVWRKEVNVSDVIESSAELFDEKLDRQARTNLNVSVLPAIRKYEKNM